ncbi:hypothetical protein GLOTRDRAFT_132992 [Gloeophyllum trabeum ATCC 11539]|uniref:Uncharacterized protein n=1 Tax=Gloeophyllum trabeum (strain ATCC 11539 / FP-39264 / Madison 617) TaxID=670483 RepID=S7PVF9_GLOTA|nr:uncharacterized protein GLOTRDRAFT_132992 [Gloeophyllum trabeum ATCC 11539]EPQ51621.1 hypothetical protein GLOTRDRAFT_132992 [Gloeophyllum trabeum ATCC 11539]
MSRSRDAPQAAGRPNGGAFPGSPDPNNTGRNSSPFERYTERTVKRLRAIIHDRRSRALPSPPSDIIADLTRLERRRFSGRTRDVVDIAKWLHELLDEYHVLGIASGESDRQQVLYVSRFLDGNAAEWYYMNVSDIDQEVEDWSFPGLDVAMYKTFVDARVLARQTAATKRSATLALASGR